MSATPRKRPGLRTRYPVDPDFDFLEIVESSLQGMIVHRGKILWMNQTMMDMVEVDDAEDLSSEPMAFDYVHPDDAALIADNTRRRLTGEPVPPNYEFRIVSTTGRVVHVDMRASTIQWHDGPAVLAALYDITAQKEAEHRQALSEAINSGLFELSPDLITITGLETGEYIRVNDSFLKTFGYTEGEVIGRKSSEISIWHILEQRDQILRKVREDGFVVGFEARCQAKTGEIVDISLSAMILNVANEKLLCIIGRDISERLAFEESLRQSKEEAERASVAKSDFLANMSHEIRTPMNGVLGMTEVLLESGQDEIATQRLNVVKDCGESLLSLLNDILDLSKLEAGRIEIFRQRITVSEMLTDVESLFQHTAVEKGVELTILPLTNVPVELTADPARMRQVLFNLVGNALKFTSEGSVEVGVTPVIRPDGCEYMEFSVTDTGIGIRPEDCEILFDRFAQVDEGPIRQFGGAGLGLAISRQFVELMGGYIDVESELQKGSRFYFGLPLDSENLETDS